MVERNVEWRITDIIIAFTIMFATSCIFLIEEYQTKIFLHYLPFQLFWAFTSLLITASGALYLFAKYPIKLENIGFIKGNLRKIIIYGGVGGFLISVIEFPFKIITGQNRIPAKIFLNLENDKYCVLIFLLIVGLLIPLVEEVFHRGGVYRILRNRFNVFWGYLGSMGIFVFGHSFNSSLGAIIQYTISSFILTYIYEKSKLIGSCIIAHILWNLSWYITVYSYDLRLIGWYE